MSELEASPPLLTKLMHLDPRGGYFNQSDLSEAMTASVTVASQEAQLQHRLAENHYTYENGVEPGCHDGLQDPGHAQPHQGKV